MSDISAPAPWGYSIFCDDIRQEMGAKVSLIGIYQGYMYVPEFPIVIPKFCVQVNYVEDFGVDIPDLELQLYLPGDADRSPSISVPIPKSGGPVPKPPAEHFDDPKIAVVIPLIFAPLEIKMPGAIKVRMRRGKDIVRLSSLYVIQAINSQGPK